MSEDDLSTKPKTSSALRVKVLSLMRSSGFGYPGPEVERDPAAAGPSTAGPSTRSRTRAGVAQPLEKVEVAEMGRLAQGPELLPLDLVKTLKCDTQKHSDKWRLGVTQVHSKFAFTVVLNT